MPVLSVVIPTWNRSDNLIQTLTVLREHRAPPFEVIVVDNASTDGTAERVLAAHPEVRLIRLPRNLGPAGARNIGVLNARAEYIVLLDSDTEPMEGALEAVHRRLEGDPHLGVVNARQVDFQTGQPWWWWDPHGFSQAQYLDREFDSAAKLMEGACGIRRSMFLEVGGFDERFFFGVEGRDLAARVVNADYSIRYCPEVHFLHRADSNRPTSNAVYRRSGRLYYEFRNEIWYTWRYFPVGWALLKSALNLASNFSIAVRENAVGAYIRGYVNGIGGLGWVLRNRVPLSHDGLLQVVSRDNRRWMRGGNSIKPAPLAEASVPTSTAKRDGLEPPPALRRIKDGEPAKPRYRLAFLMQRVLGHAAHAASLEPVVHADPEVDAVWIPITYWREGGWIEGLPALPSGVKGTARAATEVWRALGRERVDGILFNSPTLATSAGRWMRRIPTTISMDVTPRQFDREGIFFGHHPDGNDPIGRFKHRVNIRTFERSSALVTWSSWARASLETDYQIDPSTIEVIPPGVDLEAWRPRAARSGKPPHILFVGGNFRRKGGDVLLDWFREQGRGKCKLEIVSNDPEVAGLDGPDIHVHRDFRPNDPELRRLYWTSDILVLPSRSEPFGIVCIEAMASNLPVVASSVGGLTDIVEDGVSGHLVAPDDPLQFEQAMAALLRSPARRRQMGAAGRRIAEQRFDAERNGRRLLSLLKATIDRRRQPGGVEPSPAMTR